MSRRWFGTDGIRGRAGTAPLVSPFLVRLGHALGEQAAAGAGLVLLARDTRISGPAIVRDLVDGLLRAGVRVVDLGVMPTAALPMAMRARGADRGVVVSASHNPWADNGLKVFGEGGLKLCDEREAALEQRIEQLDDEPDAGAAGPRTENGAAEYVAALRARFGDLDLSGLRLAVDCAHGSASETAPAVLLALGAELSVLAAAPDGRNINEGCGSTHLGHLAGVVAAGDFDLGLAFDGDADRVLMVDAAGRNCDGDHMLGLLATSAAAAGALPDDTVVATVMSNLGLERMLAEHLITLHRTPVGDRHVLAAMAEHGFGLGGEASGHLLFAEAGAYIGDGLYTALRVLAAVKATGSPLSAAIDAVPRVPQVLLNVPVEGRPPVESLDALQAAVAAAEAAHGRDIRIVLRYSGTEDLARVMVEGTSADVVTAVSGELAELWAREIHARLAPGQGP